MTHNGELIIKREGGRATTGEKKKRSTRIKKLMEEKFLLGVHNACLKKCIKVYNIALKSYGLLIAFSPPRT